MTKPEDDKKKDTSTTKTEGEYNTPIDPSQRHTGMYEAGDGTDEAQPEGGSADTGTEGAPNQGIEKR
ncbi:MAG: hypothetical protein KME20_14335 [Kaiparowitsia implicata GSE-PSE-MK54-09C]|jgi:photosystem I subunit 4|nr:hypothetical protein [Kaiparowitsia implicata GSE-PSE-MK54-09C]